MGGVLTSLKSLPPSALKNYVGRRQAVPLDFRQATDGTMVAYLPNGSPASLRIGTSNVHRRCYSAGCSDSRRPCVIIIDSAI